MPSRSTYGPLRSALLHAPLARCSDPPENPGARGGFHVAFSPILWSVYCGLRARMALAQGGFRRYQTTQVACGLAAVGPPRNRPRFSKKPTRLLQNILPSTSHLHHYVFHHLHHTLTSPSHIILAFLSTQPWSLITLFSLTSLLFLIHPATMFRPVLRTLPKTAAALRPAAVRSFASSSGPVFNWEDPLASKNLFTEEELAIGETAERYCQDRMLPRVLRMHCSPHTPTSCHVALLT